MAQNRLFAVIAFAVALGAPISAYCSIEVRPLEIKPEGNPVYEFILQNKSGMKAVITNYGGVLMELDVPDKKGKTVDVALGFDKVSEYIENAPYFGCIVGRVGNRIANGKFELDGKEYRLATNNDPGGIPCQLHGGLRGFNKRVWDAEPVDGEGRSGVKLHYLSNDGEEGYPGNLDVTVTYWLTEKNELVIEYRATTDKPTPVNLTQHTYFNLKGEGAGDILDHIVTINADGFTPVDKGMIPTGVVKPVKGTPFDFTKPHAIGERINGKDEQLRFGMGYDHNFVLKGKIGELKLAATVYEPKSGRFMEVLTTEPGVQFYTGNFLDGTIEGPSGRVYKQRNGFALETQHFPDSPNKKTFPSVTLRPGETYKSTTIYRFSAR